METLNNSEMAERIKQLREDQRYSLAEVGRWFDVPRQTIHQAENPERGGDKINELRAKIYARLNESATVEGPVFIVREKDPELFDQKEPVEEG